MKGYFLSVSTTFVAHCRYKAAGSTDSRGGECQHVDVAYTARQIKLPHAQPLCLQFKFTPKLPYEYQCPSRNT